MIDILFQVLIGAAVCYAVYTIISRANIKNLIMKKLSDQQTDATKAFRAEIKKKMEDGHTIRVDIWEEGDDFLESVEITGDEIADDIHENDVIYLRD